MTKRQKTTARRLGLAALLLAPLAAATLGFASAGAGAAPDDPPRTADDARALPVLVESAERVPNYQRRRVYTGALVAARRSVLSFERAGKLVSLDADEGDVVRRGDQLARLDTRRLLARRAAVAAELAEAKAVLDELVAGPRVQEIEAARAELRNLVAQAEAAKRNLARRAELVDARAVSREEYDDALYLAESAGARRDAAGATLAELEEGTRAERIDAQRARVSSTEARLADLNHELDDSVLAAPFDGTIAARRKDEGTVVAIGEPVLEIVAAEAPEAWVGLPPQAAARLGVGQELEAQIDGQTARVRVRSIAPELDRDTRTRNVVFTLAGGEGEPRGFVAGQVARVAVPQVIDEPGYWLPTAALAPRSRGLWAALVVDGGRVAARDVEVIEVDGGRSFVRGALAPGEQVIVAGPQRVVPGQRVVARPSTDAARRAASPPAASTLASDSPLSQDPQ